jgi:hypothetical protein
MTKDHTWKFGWLPDDVEWEKPQKAGEDKNEELPTPRLREEQETNPRSFSAHEPLP